MNESEDRTENERILQQKQNLTLRNREDIGENRRKATNSTSERTETQRRPRKFSPMDMNANAEEMSV